jgi:hypothetical protein
MGYCRHGDDGGDDVPSMPQLRMTTWQQLLLRQLLKSSNPTFQTVASEPGISGGNRAVDGEKIPLRT